VPGRDTGGKQEEAVSRRRLEGQSVVVTGAARGQGAAEAEAAAREGATVFATDVLGEDGEALADSLTTQGLDVHYRHAGVVDQAVQGTAECLQPVGESGPVVG
jgi:NAD(P)-dependent dehydrogenase (short-subunit alcohol dehydrogenase family)